MVRHAKRELSAQVSGAGGSTTAVSRFLNSAAPLNANTYSLVEDAISRTDYIPSMTARSLKTAIAKCCCSCRIYSIRYTAR